jgi:hypothetical protein
MCSFITGINKRDLRWADLFYNYYHIQCAHNHDSAEIVVIFLMQSFNLPHFWHIQNFIVNLDSIPFTFVNVLYLCNATKKNNIQFSMTCSFLIAYRLTIEWLWRHNPSEVLLASTLFILKNWIHFWVSSTKGTHIKVVVEFNHTTNFISYPNDTQKMNLAS